MKNDNIVPLIVYNINLGAWIHTRQRRRLPRHARARLRSRIVSAYEKRSHEMITIQVAFTGHGDRVLALMTHTAVVKPAKQIL